MKNRRAIAFAASVLIFGPAQAAGLFRAYLASDGLDSNPCTVAAPCRLLPAALAAVTDGGEIWMLDSANYNAATVDVAKSVTILAVPGAVGSVVSISGAALNVSTPGVALALRNLRIVPLPGGGGTSGIHVHSTGKLTVEDGFIAGHLGNGILVAAQATVRITNSIIRDNSENGLSLQAGAKAEISGSRLQSNGTAGVAVVAMDGVATSATISDSVLSANSSGVMVIADGASSNARTSIARSTLSDHPEFGVRVLANGGAAALASVGGSMVTGNGTGLSQGGAGATLESLGDNMIRQNTTPTLGTITPVPLM